MKPYLILYIEYDLGLSLGLDVLPAMPYIKT